ncbi:MAG: hypothetical protein J6U88_05100, partial [Bacteroidales bacterium]|nr:hypothetical protein [Bacteroidales bacterium]
ERVYVSTDKDIYLAGEDIWYSLYCFDHEGGGYSGLSDVAYLQFVSNDGVAATAKGALIGGRGCGRFRIPMTLPTGNYSIVSYTKCDGGDAVGEFNGKVISIFNTSTTARVQGGVVSRGQEKEVICESDSKGDVQITIGLPKDGVVPILIENGENENLDLSISVFHLDELEEMSGSYNSTSLLERKGDFGKVEEVDYAGEIVTVQVEGKDGSSMAGSYVYMSAMGNTDDVYINKVAGDGTAVFHTGNIMGQRDLVFEVDGYTSDLSSEPAVKIKQREYLRIVAQIPPLEIVPQMERALVERGRRMQISRRFEADTLWEMCHKKDNSFLGNTPPLVYNLDDYTRFQNLEEVLREYVDFVRVRRSGGVEEIKVLWESQTKCLALLDGIPISDHSVILGIDQHLIKQIVVYPKRYMLNHLMFDGVVNFITYKGDMAGVRLPRNVSIVEFNGVSWPQAFLGMKAASEKGYPNFLSTIYWNPIVEIPANGEFEFKCILPQYEGKFKVVIEGLTENGREVYSSHIF